MRLWRLTRPNRLALDGEGSRRLGGRYASPGQPLVNFASEAALAVLVALRYVEQAPDAFVETYALGWTEIDRQPDRVPDGLSDPERKAFVDDWAATHRSLLIAVQSRVLPEADVVLMNPLHPEAAYVRPLTTRPFTFAQCLHRPPMLAHFKATRD